MKDPIYRIAVTAFGIACLAFVMATIAAVDLMFNHCPTHVRHTDYGRVERGRSITISNETKRDLLIRVIEVR